MRDFKRALRNLPKPHFPMEGFKRALHRDLRAAYPELRVRDGWRRPGFAGMAAWGFAALVVLFILKPAFPARLHAILMGNAAQISSLPTAVDAEEGRPFAVAGQSGEEREIFERLLRGDLASPERDQALIRTLYQRAYPRTPLEVRNMQDQIYTVRRFNLNRGQQAVVYTELTPSRVVVDSY